MERALQGVVDVDLTQLYFMTSSITSLFEVPNCRITRCGYTGEDGVEVSLDSQGPGHRGGGSWGSILQSHPWNLCKTDENFFG